MFGKCPVRQVVEKEKPEKEKRERSPRGLVNIIEEAKRGLTDAPGSIDKFTRIKTAPNARFSDLQGKRVKGVEISSQGNTGRWAVGEDVEAG